MTATARPLPRWAAVALAAVAGLVGVAAFPPYGCWPLAAVSIAGFSVAVRGRTVVGGAGLGYLYGWTFFGPLLMWTGTFVGPVWLFLPMAEAAFFAALGAVLPGLLRLRYPSLWTTAAWVGEEALRDRLPFGGFPWGRWAFSQSASPVRWFAALGGAPLVTAAVACAGAGLAVLTTAITTGLNTGVTAESRRGSSVHPHGGHRTCGEHRASRRRAAVAGLALAAVVPLAGAALARPLGPSTPAHSAVVALIQGDVPDRGLEFNARRRQVLDNHVRQTLTLAAQVRAGTVAAPDLVVWPENASDIDPLTNVDAGAQIERAVRAVGVPILVGAILDGPGPDHVRNVGILWSPVGGPGSQYVKRHPVPFGEYLPLRPIATRISSDASLIARDMAAGSGTGLVTGGPFPLGDVICFEVAYDSLVRSSVRAGAQLLVVQTNNATFGHSAETYQQLAMTRLRAVENGRTVLQVATSGKSAIVGPDGRILAQSGALFTPAVIVRSVGLSRAMTPATRVGGWPETILSLLALVGVAWSILRSRRPTRSRRPNRARRSSTGRPDGRGTAPIIALEERIEV